MLLGRGFISEQLWWSHLVAQEHPPSLAPPPNVHSQAQSCWMDVVTHLMVPCLSLALLICVSCAAAVGVTPSEGCTGQACYKLRAELSTKAQPRRQAWADRVVRNVSLTSEYVDIILLAEMHQQKCKHKWSLILLQVFFSLLRKLGSAVNLDLNHQWLEFKPWAWLLTRFIRVLNDSLERVSSWSLAVIRFEACVRVHIKYMYEGS